MSTREAKWKLVDVHASVDVVPPQNVLHLSVAPAQSTSQAEWKLFDGPVAPQVICVDQCAQEDSNDVLKLVVDRVYDADVVEQEVDWGGVEVKSNIVIAKCCAEIGMDKGANDGDGGTHDAMSAVPCDNAPCIALRTARGWPRAQRWLERAKKDDGSCKNGEAAINIEDDDRWGDCSGPSSGRRLSKVSLQASPPAASTPYSGHAGSGHHARPKLASGAGSQRR